MTGRLDGKIAQITGAGGGIGRATALRWASEGASVAALDINTKTGEDTIQQLEAAGGTGRFIAADLTRPEEAERAVGETVDGGWTAN